MSPGPPPEPPPGPGDPMRLRFDGEVVFWRGPAPWHYVRVPDGPSAEIAALAPVLTYGWGVIPVTAQIGRTAWATSLFPKDGGYLVPLKAAVRVAEGIALGDVVTVGLTLNPRA